MVGPYWSDTTPMKDTVLRNRRSFLGISAAAPLIVSAQTAFGYQANSAVEVGIVGCGGRGNYVGNFFVEYSGAKVVALADPIKASVSKHWTSATRKSSSAASSSRPKGPSSV